MQERTEQIVASFGEALRDGSATVESWEEAFETLSGLSPVTELDRMHQLVGYVRLLDLVLDNVAADEGGPLRSERARIFGLVQRQYGSPETPYVRSRTIVEEVAARLAAGEAAGEVTREGMQSLEAIEFDPEDEAAVSAARLAVYALNEAYAWLSGDDAGSGEPIPAEAALRLLASALGAGGFDGDAVTGSVQELVSGELTLDGTPAGHVRALAVAVGLGLRAAPGAMPALETPIGLLAEAWVEASPAREAIASDEAAPSDEATVAVGSGTAGGEPAATEATDFAARCEAVLVEFDRAVNAQGFSEYVMDQAVAGLRQMEPGTEEEGRSLRTALVRLLDMAIEHAPPEGAETLRVARESILAQDAPPQPPVDAAGVQAEGERILERLRVELAEGGAPSPAVMRAITGLQALGGRIADGDDDAAGELLRLMPAIVELSAPYAEPGKELLAEDMAGAIRELMGEAEAMLEVGPADAEIAAKAGLDELQRLMHRPLQDPFEQPDAPSHQRQFAALLRPLSDRLNALGNLSEMGPRDAAEAKRIAERADIALKRLRNATTGAQWIEHQRSSLRRAVVDLRRFERRHHLTLIEPPWPADPATIDANAVFFSGGSDARSLVDSACARIGMDAPVARGVDDPVRTRWDLLRRSAVAVFDFSSYDPAAADPPGPIPAGMEQRAVIVRAASRTAQAAYECGWALVLGTPIVILGRAEQPPPFDIDVEPVLVDDGDDAGNRVVLAIQAALFGVQRGVRSADLGPTVARLRERFGDEPDCAELVEAIRDSNDAMQVQLAARALLERAAGRGAMLALPAFPPPRAPVGDTPTLFHVTAFRSWSKPCEDVIRDACRETDIEYRIGYERLDPDILGAIWNDIAGASLVVADLTNLNPNAALELAVAQALGRPTMVLSQTAGLPVHFPALAKVRVHEYTTDESGRLELSRLIGRFVAGET